MACWFLPTDISQLRALMTISANSVSGYVSLVTNGGLEALDYNGNASLVASATNVWHHAGGVFTSSASRTGYLDGVAGVTNTGASSAGAAWVPGCTTLGAIRFSGVNFFNYFDGSIAEAAIWNISLSAADMTDLAAGLSPLSVRPDALVAYWPLMGGLTHDVVGRFDMALNGATASAHPRIFRPTNHSTRFKRNVVPKPQAVVANGTPQSAGLSLRHGLNHKLTEAVNGIPQVGGLSLLRIPFDTTKPAIQIAGVTHTQDVLFDTLRIDQRVGEEPDQCTFATVINPSFVPTVGMTVAIGLGNASASNLIFGGTILTVDQVYKDLAANVAYDITCQDYTFLLNGRRPVKSYVATAASTIISDLVTNFASGSGVSLNFTASNLTLSLNFDGNAEFSQCLTRITGLLGAHWIVDPSRVLQVFSAGSFPGTVPATINAADIAATNRNGARQLKITTDESQIRNKIYVEGGGGVGAIQGTASVTPPGLTGTSLPVSQSAGFSGGGACVIYYTIPGTYPVVTRKFFCTFSSTTQGGFVLAPISGPNLVSVAAGGNVDSGTSYWWAYGWSTSAGATGVGPTSSLFVPAAGQKIVTLGITGGAPVEQDVTTITVYRSYAASHGGNSGSLFAVGTIARPAGGAPWPSPLTFVDNVNDSNLGGSPPVTAGTPCPQGAVQQSFFSVLNLPSLNGLASLTGTLPTIPAGASVNVAGLYDGSAGSPYGVREYWISDNECVTPALCLARAQAEYNLFGQPLVEATYQTRDINTRAGKRATFSLGSPTNFSNTLLIQSVTITQFGVPFTLPLRQVKAASTKFTLQDLLRRMGGFLNINGVVVAAG